MHVIDFEYDQCREFHYLDVSVGSFSDEHRMLKVLHDRHIIGDLKAFSVEKSMNTQICFLYLGFF